MKFKDMFDNEIQEGDTILAPIPAQSASPARIQPGTAHYKTHSGDTNRVTLQVQFSSRYTNSGIRSLHVPNPEKCIVFKDHRTDETVFYGLDSDDVGVM